MARKLNKALVSAVAGVAILGGGAYFAAPRVARLIRPTSKLVEAGDDAVKRGDWDAAALNYGKAASREGSNIDLQLKVVDANEYTVRGEVEKLRALRAQQAQILANDPRNVPALRRVLAYQKTDVQRNPSDNASVRSLVGTAERLEKLVPGDVEARLARVTATLEPYARNLETKADDVDAQRDVADKVLAEAPGNAEAAFDAGQFRSIGVTRAAQQGDAADAKDKLAKALAWADDAVAKGPANAGAWMMRSELYRLSAYLNAADDAKRAEIGKTYFDSLQKASDLVDPTGPLAVPIKSAALKQMELRDPKAAEAAYRKFLTDRPDDRQPRLMLAEFLARQPSRRDEAVAVLDKPFEPAHPVKALESVDNRLYDLIERVRKTAIRLGALATVTDPAERKKRLDVIEAEYRALSSDPDISTRFKAAVLRVQGGIELAQNKITDAIATLDSAIKQMNPDSPSNIEQDMRNDALLEYAQAQLRLNQTGEARPALAELVGRRPENLMARAMLADVLLAERSFDQAGQQIDILTRFAPGSPLIQSMKARYDAMTGKLGDTYQQMAEGTRDQQLLKLRSAATLSKSDEVARLARKMLAADPADPDAVQAIVQVSLAADKRDDAVAAVAAAQKARPDDARFKTLAANLAAVTKEQRDALVKSRVNDIADPYERALVQADVARQEGRPADAIEAFRTAGKLKPEDARAYEGLFTVAIQSRRFADADGVLGDLARTNADQAGGAIRRVQLAAARATVETEKDRREAAFKDVTNQAQTVVTQNPNLAAATLLYAQVLAQGGDLAGAIDQFGQTLDKAPTNLDAMFGIADCLLRTDRRTEAHDRVAAVIGAAPNDPRTVALSLDYELKFGDPLKAIDTLQRRVAAAPQDAQSAARLGLAFEQVAAGRPADEAKEYLQKAGDVYDAAYARFPQDVRFLSASADVRRRLGDAEGAEKAIEKAAADPANAGRPEVTLLLADAYRRDGKVDDAVRVLTDLVNTVKPAPAEAVQRLSTIFASQNRVQDALNILDLRSDDPAVQRQRVTLLLDANQLDAARQVVDSLIASHPDADTYLLAAYAELRAGNAEKCEGFANKVLALRPADVLALYYRGQVRMNRPNPDLDAAMADLTKARDLAPNSPELRITLAELFRRRGDRDAALNELQAAWQADKSNKTVMLKLVDAYTGTVPPAWTAVDRTLAEAKANPQLGKDFDVLLTAGEAYAARNDTPKAVEAAKAALAVAPDDANAQRRYFELLLRAKAFRPVIDETAAKQTDKPDGWWVYRVRGLAQAGLEQKDEAKKSLDAAFNLAAATTDANAISQAANAVATAFGPAAAAAKLEPFDNPALRLFAAGYVRDAGDMPAAAKKYEELLKSADKLNPNLVRRAKSELATVCLQLSPPDGVRARSLFEDVAKESPRDPTVMNNLACTLLLPDVKAAPAEALAVAQKAYDLVNNTDSGPIVQIVQDTYGWALFKNDRVTEAVDMLKRASESAQFPDVFLHLAEAYLQSGNLDGADSALVDAKNQLANAERRKQPIDASLKAKYQQLTDDLAKKRTAAAGA